MNKNVTVRAYYKFLDGLHKRKIEESVKLEKPREANDPKVFEELCHTGTKACIIGFFNKIKEGRFRIDMEQFEQAKSSELKKRYHWVWVDGNCHLELVKQLGFTA